MCQPLPYADFRWVDDVSSFDASSIALDSPTGYILEVDLEYPQHLHNAHTDLSFSPTRDKPSSKRDLKLLATLYDKKHYVIHYRNLKQCTRYDLCVTKIQRILQFSQFPRLRNYIELNTHFRTVKNRAKLKSRIDITVHAVNAGTRDKFNTVDQCSELIALFRPISEATLTIPLLPFKAQPPIARVTLIHRSVRQAVSPNRH